jgi:Fur family iron response transcriptional regulator
MVNLSNKYSLDRGEVVELLKSYDISPTRQRVEIAEFLFRKQQHLSAENILEGVNDKGHRVSRATVYNSMGLFANKGLVREVLIDRERVFYDSNNSLHHHIYNMDTGELMDVEGSGIEITGLPEMIDGARVVDSDVIVRVSNK